MYADRHMPMCWMCQYYNREDDTCLPFPDGIPREILESRYDHRRQHPDQKGVETFFPINEAAERAVNYWWDDVIGGETSFDPPDPDVQV